MKRVVISLLLAFFCQSFLHAAVEEKAITRRLDEELAPIIQKDLSRFNLPGMSIAVICDGKTIWAKGFGYADREKRVPATPETVYRVGSLSKLFNATAVMLMQEQQRLSIDEGIKRYLPRANFVYPFGDESAKITLRHILSHRAGTTRECPVGHYFDDSEPSPKETAVSLFGTTLVYPPGAKTKYSNSAIGVCGYILEKTVGMEYSTFQKNYILQPLGMASSSFTKQESFGERLAKGYMRNLNGDQWEAPDFRFGYISAANLYSTVTDMAKFIDVMCNQGRPLLKPESFREMTTVQFEPKDVTQGFGLGFELSRVHNERTLGHLGAVYGFSSSILVMPDGKLGAVSLVNLDGCEGINNKYIHFALGIALEEITGRRLLHIPSATELPASKLKRLAGRYQRGEAVAWLTVKKGSLCYEPPGGTRRQLTALSENEFITDDYFGYGQEISIVRQEEKVAGIKINDAFYIRTEEEGFPWQNLIGEYGPDYNITQVYEKDGKLTVLVEWFYEYTLKHVEGLRFAYPFGLYHGEEVRFIESEGRIQALEFSGAVFKRRG
ncbi:MAG: beta-lactamase family protein [Phycisphaerales bacterium]|nr:MAG: beta-lactamase family protein [Phycisphaerales bacterium]